MTRTIDDLLPAYDRREVHRRTYTAPPAAVRAALDAVTPAELPLTRTLFAVRRLRPVRSDRPLLERLGASGFSVLVDTPGELVVAVVGRFWRPSGGPRLPVRDADDFRDFGTPGYAKAVMSFELLPRDGGTEVVTETRVQATDVAARRAFTRYWLLVRPGSGLIRHELLAAVGRRLRHGAV